MKKTGIILICTVLIMVIASTVLATDYTNSYNCSSSWTKTRTVGYNDATFYFEKGGLFTGDSIALARRSCDSHSDKMIVFESITTTDNNTNKITYYNRAANSNAGPLGWNFTKSNTRLAGSLWKAAKKTNTKFTDDYLYVNTWTINGSK